MEQRQEFPEMQCSEVREGLSAMLDGETDEQESAALHAHLEVCVECAAFDRVLRNLHARLDEELTDVCDADRIWTRVQAGMAAHDASSAAHAALHHKWWQLKPGQLGAVALAATLLIGVIVGGQQLWRPDPRELPVITETVRDFETFRLRGELLDIAANEPAAVRRWMAEKVDFELPGDVTPPDGFRIAGGRLCSFLNRRLAFFHYEKGASGLSLYVMKASGLTLPNVGGFDTAYSARGLTTVAWRQSGRAFVVVSELPAADVSAFATRLMKRGATPSQSQL